MRKMLAFSVSLFRRCFVPGLLVMLLLWAVGQITRDSSWLTGMFFYIPSPFLVVAFGFTGVVSLAKLSLKRGIALLVLALGPLLMVVFVENSFSSPDVSPEAEAKVRVVHWNVAFGNWGWDAVYEELKELAADAYVIGEMPRSVSISTVAASIGTGYQAFRVGTMTVMVRGRILERTWLVENKLSEIYVVTFETAEGRVKLFAVDLPANPLVRREPLLKELRSFMEIQKPDVVMGDFNAPRRSRVLADLPPGYRHAYDSAGSGLSYSWPVPIPMLAIDQCIHGERVLPKRYELRATLRSDHKLGILDFSLRR